MTTHYPLSVPEIQEPKLSAAALTQNQWFDVLSETANTTVTTEADVVVYAIIVRQATLAEDLEIELTTNEGTEVVSQAAAVANDQYFITTDSTAHNDRNFGITTVESPWYRSFLFGSGIFGLRIRKTTANGANATQIKLVWAKY